MKTGKRTKALALFCALAAASAVVVGAGPAQADSAAQTAASICGSGYSPDAAYGLQGGTIYVSYNGYTDCAVLIKTVDVGTPTETWVYAALDSSGTGGYGGNDGYRDDGSFSYYAGPVRVDAPHKCIEVAGGTVLPNDEIRESRVLCG